MTGPDDVNAVGRMLALLGDEWTLLIVRESLLGARRFTDFAALPISNAVLSNRLRSLVDDGLLERRIYQSQPPRADYHPTEPCRALWPVLVSIWHWERTWVEDRTTSRPSSSNDAIAACVSRAAFCTRCVR